MSEPASFGPPPEILTSIYQIGPEVLEALAQWIEQRGIRTPVSNVVGGSAALTRIKGGNGSPETVVTAAVGSLYLRLDGGAATTLYVKESGTGNTGWIGK